MFRRIVEDYEARLEPVDGSAGGAKARGKAEWERYGNGATELSVRVYDIELPDGTVLTVFLPGGDIGTIELRGGKGRLDIESEKGDTVPSARTGDPIAVAAGETALLRGTFVED